MGCLKDLLGDGSCIDLGILINATVEESWKHRKRSHRVVILNRVEEEIEKSRRSRVDEEDISLWLNGKGQRKKMFSTQGTWEFIREKKICCEWADAVWFKYSTPRYSFILWMVMKGRLATGDKMRIWMSNINVECVLCNEPLETLEHLFFECSYSAKIWEVLMKEILKDQYTVRWVAILRILRDPTRCKMQLFIIKYLFQATVYMIWRERNRRRHGEAITPAEVLIKLLDKNMRNKLTLIQRKGDDKFRQGMQFWFNTR